jgi:hypothetical protein
MQEIKYHNKTLAWFFSKNLKADGVKFLTPSYYPLQVGLLEHRKGKIVKPHIHRDLKYKVDTTQEFLYMERGIADVLIYNRQWKKIKGVRLTKGDFILFVGGGHSLNIHKNTRIIEIKQGPYPGDKKAKIFKDK